MKNLRTVLWAALLLSIINTGASFLYVHVKMDSEPKLQADRISSLLGAGVFDVAGLNTRLEADHRPYRVNPDNVYYYTNHLTYDYFLLPRFDSIVATSFVVSVVCLAQGVLIAVALFISRRAERVQATRPRGNG